MVLGRMVYEKRIGGRGAWELLRRGNHYVLVREGYAVLLLNKKELLDLKKLLEEVVG